MTLDENPIVEEVRRVREQLLAEHHGDLDSLITTLQTLSAQRTAARDSTPMLQNLQHADRKVG